jgi:hypothetical protein
MDEELDVDFVMTKRDVVRQEIDTAIDIMLSDGSMIAAHVLASAASEILKGVGSEVGTQTLSSMMDLMIRPDKKKEFYKAFKGHYNFAKHADNDPSSEKSFRPRIALITVFQAIVDYQLVYGVVTIPMLLFQTWTSLGNKEIFEESYHPIIDSHSRLFDGDHSISKLKSLYVAYNENQHLLFRNMPDEMKLRIEF